MGGFGEQIPPQVSGIAPVPGLSKDTNYLVPYIQWRKCYGKSVCREMEDPPRVLVTKKAKDPFIATRFLWLCSKFTRQLLDNFRLSHPTHHFLFQLCQALKAGWMFTWQANVLRASRCLKRTENIFDFFVKGMVFPGKGVDFCLGDFVQQASNF